MSSIFVVVLIYSWVFGEVYGVTTCYKVDGTDDTIVGISFNYRIRFVPTVLFISYRQTELYASFQTFLQREGKKRLIQQEDISCSEKRLEFSKLSEQNMFERSFIFLTLSLDYAGSQIIDNLSFKTRIKDRYHTAFGLSGATHISVKMTSTESTDFITAPDAAPEVPYLDHSGATDFSLQLFDHRTSLHLKIKTGSKILQKKITEYATLKVSLATETGVVVKDPAPIVKKVKISPFETNAIADLTSNFLITEEFVNYFIVFQLIGSDNEVLGKAVYPPKRTEFGQSTVKRSDFEIHGISYFVADTTKKIDSIKQAPLWFLKTRRSVYRCSLLFGPTVLIDYTWNGHILFSESRYNQDSLPDKFPGTQTMLHKNEFYLCKDAQTSTF
ncbi:hypothetical protein RF11_14541 [Thelohanellus kitauei]|uniref:Uncharacterized protein n=1 Tax=Thelohanellus kitauei TaxID=669202 RepID=A0A0C2IYH0_THEKT|nr:hypothetical protein RF11_14541 [Thelohanellus kitauei]